MKTIFTFFITFLFLNTSAQNYLTKGQVYDFNVGDVFQSERSSSGMVPPTYTTKKVLSKVIALVGDTITYSINAVSITLPSCQTCSALINTANYNLKVYNLSDSIINTALSVIQPLDTMISVIDTVLNANGCWKRARSRFQKLEVPSLTPTYLYGETYIEGCGGPYNSMTSTGIGSSSIEVLTYYKKGNDSCGNFFNLPASISTVNLGPLNLKLYPNPTQEKLIIASSSPINRYTIWNFEGRMLQTGTVKDQTITVKSLSSGLYLLQVEDAFQNKISRTFLKE